jgi:membrane protease YdiL (CAAX protease family)
MNETKAALEMKGSATAAAQRVSRAQFLHLSKWFTLALCLTAIVLPLAFGKPGVWTALELTGLATLETLLSGIIGLVVGWVLVVLITHWRPLHVIAERLTRLVAWETFQTFDYVVIAVLAALGEELLFRGALQPLIGLLTTALLFGLLHATAVAHIVLAGLLGLLLGWLYRWSGSLWSPIAAHLGVDLVTGLLLARKWGSATLGASNARGD